MQVADFQWVPQQPGRPGDPFMMASVSDNGVGGTLQLWRINDMIWLPEDVVLAELEEHRCPPLPYFQTSSPTSCLLSAERHFRSWWAASINGIT